MERTRAKWLLFGMLGAGSILGVGSVWLGPELVFNTLFLVMTIVMVSFTVGAVMLSPLIKLLRAVASGMSRNLDYGP